ncbi:MAG TPA: diguanylate cyclase [Candidatus Acidoferrum sp.]|nr:diguanylate cyclase [Candidatus Acidoferrum sp.]
MCAEQPSVSNEGNSNGRKLRVLMAETDPPRISKMLRSLYPDDESALQLTLVSTVSVLLPTIQLVGPEVLFLDLAASGQDAMATVRAVHRAAPNLPLITLAATPEKEIAEQSVREGALDFVLKDVADVRTLERVLRSALERNTVSGLADLLRDRTTELYNGDGFRALTAKAVQAAQRTGGQLVLLTIRIANLEALRKEFGPSDGDSAIKDTAEMLKGSFRRTDVLARLSEGNFAVLAADAAEPSVAIMRQRLETRRAAMNNMREPWGAVELAIEVGFWSSREEVSFSEIADPLLKEFAELSPALAMAASEGEKG